MPSFSQSAQDFASVLSQQDLVAALSQHALVQSVHSVVSSAAFLLEQLLQELTPARRSAAHTTSSKLLNDVDFTIVQGIYTLNFQARI